MLTFLLQIIRFGKLRNHQYHVLRSCVCVVVRRLKSTTGVSRKCIVDGIKVALKTPINTLIFDDNLYADTVRCLLSPSASTCADRRNGDFNDQLELSGGCYSPTTLPKRMQLKINCTSLSVVDEKNENNNRLQASFRLRISSSSSSSTSTISQYVIVVAAAAVGVAGLHRLLIKYFTTQTWKFRSFKFKTWNEPKKEK